MHLSDYARSTMADALADICDSGGLESEGYLEITEVGSGTVLATIPFNGPAFGNAANGVITLDISPTVEDSAADATGTAAEFFLHNRDGAIIMDGSVGTSSADLILNSVSIVQNVPVQITSCVITVPSGNYT